MVFKGGGTATSLLELERMMNAIRSEMIPDAKFCTHQEIRGKHYGRFVVVGHHWSGAMGEHVYECYELSDRDVPVGRCLRLVESSFAEA